MRSTPSRFCSVLLAVGSVLVVGRLPMAAGQWPTTGIDISELWQRPTLSPTADLTFGPWGPDFAPSATATYIVRKKQTKGSSPEMTAVDPQGRVWHIEQGREAEPETLVSHVLSAVGYHQPPVYFLTHLTYQEFAAVHSTRGGRFRLTVSSLKRGDEWDWESSPFAGMRPYQGLLAILVLLNSANLKNSHNSIYELVQPQGPARTWYVVRDLGTSLGDTSRFDPAPNRIDIFERVRFVTGVKHGYAEFDYHGVHADLVRSRITVDDVHWACRLLGTITERQWNELFAGAGYDPVLAERFIRRVRQKIQEGTDLPSDPYRLVPTSRPGEFFQ